MGAFEYLSVLISIMLGMTRVLAGVGEMLPARSPHRIYWVHAMWIINLFLCLVSSQTPSNAYCETPVGWTHGKSSLTIFMMPDGV
jgi:hypothetical protein